MTDAATRGNFQGSVCPHDCPSTCALEVEVLRDAGGVGRGIGTVRGAEANSYTAGVICAKVARYAERVHHKDRLLHPLLRNGPKGSGQFRRIGWDEALDRITHAFQERTAQYGSETVWPYYYAGTMGLVQRDGIHRLRHAMRYSGQQNTICTALCESGWQAGVGRFGGPDPREMAEADLIVMWGGNPVATQVNVMTHVTRARKARGAKLVVVDPYRTGTAAAADLHLALRPGDRWRAGLRGDARRLPRRVCGPRLHGADVGCAGRIGSASCRARDRTGRAASPASPSPRSRPSPRSTAEPSAPISAVATASPGAATARPRCTPSPACRPLPASGSTRAAAPSGPTGRSTIGTRR